MPARNRDKRYPFGGRSNLPAQAVADRGKRLNNIWYQFSPSNQRDYIFSSDAEFDDFHWLEGDPTVESFTLQPSPTIVPIGGDLQKTQFDALVFPRQGRPQLREVKEWFDPTDIREQQQFEAQKLVSADAGYDYVRISRVDLDQNIQLIRNWRCAIAHMAACRKIALSPYRNELSLLFTKLERTTIEGALSHTDPLLKPVYLAALFYCLQSDWLCSDLALKPLCFNSTIWLRSL
jgi:hypothetical protein